MNINAVNEMSAYHLCLSEDQKRSGMYYDTDHIYFCSKGGTWVYESKRDHKADSFCGRDG